MNSMIALLLLCCDGVILWKWFSWFSAHLIRYMFPLHCFFLVCASASRTNLHFFIPVRTLLLQPVRKNVVYMCKLAPPSGFDVLGDLLKPTIPTHTAPPPPPPPQMAIHPGGKLLANDLDSSLANLMGSECSDHLHIWMLETSEKIIRQTKHEVKSERKAASIDWASLWFCSFLRSAVWWDPSQEVSVLSCDDTFTLCSPPRYTLSLPLPEIPAYSLPTYDVYYL